ncbi:MAG TPA: 5-formyltetrahydrofolate cyclo-ligase [Jatrophihabitans sp.]|jgi:5-formyltetrahydrofolate cyclo-ligase|nr:5-formyltetrahydrofolate cyclo-ligase [Jatrophihabitans sp.]
MGRDERVAAEKARLRAELLAARAARSIPDLEWARAAIRGHVLDRVGGMHCVASYVPLRTEPGSLELLAALDARGVTVLVPVLLPDRDLDWARWSADGPGNPLGVDAVQTAGLVLVPALAVAEDGTRLGRGGGSYDRALARCAGTADVAALLFEGEVVPRLPRDPWDVPVPAVVTPEGWVTLGGNAEVRRPR